jgi:hypothetical protein
MERCREAIGEGRFDAWALEARVCETTDKEER